MLNLISLFQGLEQPTSSQDIRGRFSASSIPGFERHRIAKDNEGSPALLIATQEESSHVLAPIRLEHLSVLHNMESIILHSNGTQEIGQFSIVRCVGGDNVLHTYFLQMLESVVILLGPNPSQKEVTRAINKLVELFRVMADPVRKSIQGFWAELFLIAQSTDVEMMVNAWHVTPVDMYDFNAGNQRIEVKSARGRDRQHRFALAQLQPPTGTKVLIVSVLMERAGAGVSLRDLVKEIRLRLRSNSELLIRLDEMVASTLGESWRRGLEARFDRELAEESLRCFDSSAIPVLDVTLPPSISDVHFTANLAGLTSTSQQQLRKSGGLFKAVLSR